MLKSPISSLEKSLWAELSAEAGLDAGAYKRHGKWTHSGARKHSLVALYRRDDGHGVVLKAALQDINSAQFDDLVSTQERAFADLDHASFRVPRVLAASSARKALLMEEAAGEQLFDLIESADHHEPFLERAGAWVNAFHRAGLEGPREFKPNFNIKRVTALRDGVLGGKEKICEPDEFLNASNAVLEYLPACAGPTQAAWQHGDMNLHNFIVMGDGAVCGIDLPRWMWCPWPMMWRGSCCITARFWRITAGSHRGFRLIHPVWRHSSGAMT